MPRDDVDQVVPQLAQLDFGVAFLFDGAPRKIAQLGHIAAADFVEYGFFAVDMVVERAAAEADRLAQVIDAHRMVAPLGKHQGRDANDALFGSEI